MQLNVKALVIAGAILWGGSVFTEILIGGVFGITLLCVNPEVAKILASVYPGVSLSITGAFIGLLYGIFDGALCAGIFGWLYNLISQKSS